MPSYPWIPSLSQWQSDSSVRLAVRKSDPVLARIDILISAYNDAPQQGKEIACDLYFAVDYWLKSVKTNNNMNKGREPAMWALFRCVVDALCKIFYCTVNTLPRELDLMFGRELSEVGFKTDFEHGKAEYLKRRHIQDFRIWFKGGLAYQWDWWNRTLQKPARTLVDSSNAHNPGAFFEAKGQLPNVGYGPFILTMGRDFYMARHRVGKAFEFAGFYHSSYVAGEFVMGAGSMLIERGRIKRIRSDSGHYQPTDTNMLAVLQALQMVSVPIKDIVVEDYLGKGATKAPVFLAANANWNQLTKSRDQNLDLRKRLYPYKEERRNPDRTGEIPIDPGYEENPD